jgi:hypothetical protein
MMGACYSLPAGLHRCSIHQLRRNEEKMNDIIITWGIIGDDPGRGQGGVQPAVDRGTPKKLSDETPPAGTIIPENPGDEKPAAVTGRPMALSDHNETHHKNTATEAQVAALMDEVKLWKGRAEEAAAKAISYRQDVNTMKKQAAELSEELEQVRELMKAAEREATWLQSELRKAKGENQS